VGKVIRRAALVLFHEPESVVLIGSFLSVLFLDLVEMVFSVSIVSSLDVPAA
jgi:hypothetical protein